MVFATEPDHGKSVVAKRAQEPRGGLPKSSTVKLLPETFEAVWWVARVEGKSPGEVIADMLGVTLAARRKSIDAQVERLKRLDDETAKVEAEAQQRLKSAR